jgi:hypothetical protein
MEYFTRDNSSILDTSRLHSCVITCRDFVREMLEDSDDTRCHCRFGCGLQLKQVPICWRLVLANMMNCGVRSCYSISSIISTNHKIIRVNLFVYIVHRYKYKYKYEYKYKYTIYIIYIYNIYIYKYIYIYAVVWYICIYILNRHLCIFICHRLWGVMCLRDPLIESIRKPQ